MNTELVRLAATILVAGLGLSLILCCLAILLISLASVTFHGIETLWDRWRSKPPDNCQKGGT